MVNQFQIVWLKSNYNFELGKKCLLGPSFIATCLCKKKLIAKLFVISVTLKHTDDNSFTDDGNSICSG